MTKLFNTVNAEEIIAEDYKCAGTVHMVACRGVPKHGIFCGRVLPFTEEYFTKGNKGKLALKCKQCHAKNNSHWSLVRNPESYRASEEKRRLCPERIIYRKDRSLRKKYDIGIEEFSTMLAAQNNVCYICGKSERQRSSNKQGPSRSPQPLSVDHNHETGEVRKLLCANCNRKLGHLESLLRDTEFTCKLISYINEHATKALSRDCHQNARRGLCKRQQSAVDLHSHGWWQESLYR